MGVNHCYCVKRGVNNSRSVYRPYRPFRIILKSSFIAVEAFIV
uniref:Uncharacterized protein n=1 Tax=Anguilla anguilla TaxID=7936 RepID=A0A0E9W5V7_ANGAN